MRGTDAEHSTTEVSNMLWGEYNYDEDIAAQRQEAFDDGIQQGISQGISQGELQAKIETAINLLSENIPIEIIVRTTGLTKTEVEQLTQKT